jgi:uncharacterized membrane protein YphA (DoxX/SURF4 family)
MTIVASGFSLILGVIFLTAGITKLLDLNEFRKSLVDFGVPPVLASPLGILVPLTEFAIVSALLSNRTAWWGAAGATILFVVFTAAMMGNLLLGRKPQCNCFGQFSSSPIGWSAVMRNVTICIPAAWLVWQGTAGVQFSIADWILVSERHWLPTTAVLVGAILAAICWFFLHLVKQNARLLGRIEALEAQMASIGYPIEGPAAEENGLRIGTTAPEFQLSGLYGEILTLRAFQARGKTLDAYFFRPLMRPLWRANAGDREVAA